MPKPRKAPPAASASPPASGDGTAIPAPPATLHITPWTLFAKQALHRVHENLYKADQFNPGDVIYAMPTHICPTCALHKEALVIEEGKVTDRWAIVARDRLLIV